MPQSLTPLHKVCYEWIDFLRLMSGRRWVMEWMGDGMDGNSNKKGIFGTACMLYDCMWAEYSGMISPLDQMFILNSWDPSSSKDSLCVQSWTTMWWEHGCVFCLTVSDCFFSSWTKCCWCYWWFRSQFHSTRYLVLKSNQWSLVPTSCGL